MNYSKYSMKVLNFGEAYNYLLLICGSYGDSLRQACHQFCPRIRRHERTVFTQWCQIVPNELPPVCIRSLRVPYLMEGCVKNIAERFANGKAIN